ncbi:MAG: hypothetical protein J1E37_00135 [Prevotella sp.]|nr:hypothetical protein [Prevotella sp.]
MTIFYANGSSDGAHGVHRWKAWGAQTERMAGADDVHRPRPDRGLYAVPLRYDRGAALRLAGVRFLGDDREKKGKPNFSLGFP